MKRGREPNLNILKECSTAKRLKQKGYLARLYDPLPNPALNHVAPLKADTVGFDRRVERVLLNATRQNPPHLLFAQQPVPHESPNETTPTKVRRKTQTAISRTKVRQTLDKKVEAVA